MFVELMPLLAGRTLLITVARVDDETIRVNVIDRDTRAVPTDNIPLWYRQDDRTVSHGQNRTGRSWGGRANKVNRCDQVGS
jgi:hypothetical protein